MTSRTPTNADDNRVINNFARGLNTMTPVGSYPVGASPLLDNIVVTDRGTALSRKGTYTSAKLEAQFPGRGTVIIPYQTRAGNALLFVKENTNLNVYALSEQRDNAVTAKLVMVKENVWDDAARDVKPSYVITNESVPRIILTTGVNAPVQVTIVEGNDRLFSSDINAFPIASSYFTSINADDAVAFCNGVNMKVVSASYSAGFGQFGLEGAYDLADEQLNPFGYTDIVVDGLFITWQWICEGELVSGDALYDTQTRFNTNEADLSVAVPVSLLRNLDSLKDNFKGFPIIPYAANQVADYYNASPQQKPTGVNEFCWSNGLFYEAALTNTPRPNFSHVTFGALEVDGEPTEVSFVRCFPLNFSGGGVDGSYLHVRVNGHEAVQRVAGDLYAALPSNTRAYHLRIDTTETVGLENSFYTESSIAPNNTYADFLSFDAEADFGLSIPDVVEIVYSEPKNIGSSALATPQQSFLLSLETGNIPLVDGEAYPFFGIQDHADYGSNSYPSVVGFYQGRLAIAGFANDPTKVVLSDVKGTSPNAENFSNFSLRWNKLETFEPVTVAVATGSNESKVTGLTESSGSLIVFTRSQCFRVYGGSTSIAPLSVIVSRISSIGCVNPFAFYTIDNAVYFLSESGMFRLSPSIEIGDFTLTMYSQSINKELLTSTNLHYAIVSYDRKRSTVYIAVAEEPDDPIATRLFGFSILTEAFFEYTHFTNTWMCAAMCFENLTRESYMFFVCGLPSSDNLFIISHPYFFHTDFSTHGDYLYKPPGGSGSGQGSYTIIPPSIPYVEETGTFDNYCLELKQLRAGKVNNLPDLSLVISGDAAMFNKDFYKHSRRLLLIDSLEPSGYYVAKPIDDRGVYPLRVFRNHILLEDDEYSLVDEYNDGNYTIYYNEDLSSDETVRAGYSIPYAASTPEYIRGSLSNRSFNSSIFLLLNNKGFQDLWTFVEPTLADRYKELLRTFKIRVGFNVMRTMNNSEITGERTLNLGGSEIMRWDDLKFDYQPTRAQFHDFIKVTASPKGSDDVVQTIIQTFSDKGFEIVSYQTDVFGNRRSS